MGSSSSAPSSGSARAKTIRGVTSSRASRRVLRNLPFRTETERERQKERAREKEVLKRRLAALAEDATVAKAIDDELTQVNGTPGDPESFDELDSILLEQSYRLAFWRVATEEINYRRFFDINDLAAIRMEESAVFDDAHQLILELVADGRVQGVRLDHTDGLYDPAEYFAKLRRANRECRQPVGAARGLSRRGEDPLRRRGASPALADRRDHRLRLLSRRAPASSSIAARRRRSRASTTR